MENRLYISIGSNILRAYDTKSNEQICEHAMVVKYKPESEFFAFGDDAYTYYGRENNDIEIIRPMLAGHINNLEGLTALYDYILRYFGGDRHSKLYNKELCVLVPQTLSKAELYEIGSFFNDMGYHKLFFADEMLVNALSTDSSWDPRSPFLVCDIGYSHTSVAAYTCGVKAIEKSIPYGHRLINMPIADRVKEKHIFSIGKHAVDSIKKDILALDAEKSFNYEYNGINLKTCMPGKVNINGYDLNGITDNLLQTIKELSRSVLNELTPMTAGEIYGRAIVMCGGGVFSGFSSALEKETSLNAITCESLEADFADAVKAIEADKELLENMLIKL